MLAGPRRIGKTSLALEVLQRLKNNGFYIVAVDLFRVGTKKDLAEAIVKGCFANRKEAWVNYIADKFASRDMQTEETLLERIVDLTGGHPQDIMLFCSEVYYVLLDAAKSNVTRGVLDVAFQRTMERLTPLFSEM